MKNNGEWTYGGLLKKQWGFDEQTVATIIYDNKIPAYDINYERLDAEEALHTLIEIQKFRTEDIEKFEIENGHMLDIDKHYSKIVLNAKDKRELGQLRREKEKWDSAIDAAVKIGMFCQEQNKVFIRDDIEKQVFMIDKDLPYTAFEKIWKAIPEQFRSKGGRPQKT